jgi:hypothetical protein
VVLLSCDDEAVGLAAAALEFDVDDPAADFGRRVEARFRIARDGSPDAVRRETARFRARPAEPSTVPPFFGVCCALVLAASRMTSDEGTRAHNYYERLWPVLGRQPAQPGPYDFSYVPWLFKYLAEWLENDLGGARGSLILAEGGPKHVGSAINQCLFRERDKEHLAGFFADKVGPRRDEFDLLRLLQISADRHRLTKRAQQALATRELHESARAALAAAFETWDGTRPDPRGGRSWLATLHLAVNRGMRLTVSADTAPAGLDLGDGRRLDDPARDRFRIGGAELSEMRTRGLRWGPARAHGIYLPPAGDTLIFEVREDRGLVWARAPVADHVFVLTCAHELQGRLITHISQLRGLAELPPGWKLYERVPRDMLPAGVAEAGLAHRPAVALVGGLRLGRSAFLTGFSPRVEVGDVEEQLTVRVSNEQVGALHAGGSLQLMLSAGDHVVEVGDGLARWTVHMLDRNPARPGYGRLTYPLSDRGVRLGASEDATEGLHACGALLSEPYTGDLPLMLRAREVVLITEDGVGLRESAPSAPHWLWQVGLDERGVRWAVELASDIVWVVSAVHAVAVRPRVPSRLDRTAVAAVEALSKRSNPRIHSLRRRDRSAAQAAFDVMAELAQEHQA